MRGQKLVTSWHDYPAAITGRTERHLVEWLRQNAKAGETWLDVGAHYGYTAIALSGFVGPQGRVFAFEPMLATAGALTRTRALNGLEQLTIVPVALGSKSGLHVVELPTTRGMVDSTLANGAPSERIFVWTLDELWGNLAVGNPRVDGVKIDVQGMEVHTLMGMRNVLMSHHPKLVIEIHKGVDRAEFLHLLAACGYDANSTPIEPIEGETKAMLVDNRSYAFHPAS